MGMDEVIDLNDLFFNTSYEVRRVLVKDLELRINALHDSATTDFDLTGQIIWPASRALAEFLLENKCYCEGTKKILELGAGVGLAGIIASKLADDPSTVILTDNNQHILDLLERNVLENFPKGGSIALAKMSSYPRAFTSTLTAGKPICKKLSWGKDNMEEFVKDYGDSFNLILGADVVFWPASVALLIETVSELLDHQEGSCFLLSYVERSRHTTTLLLEQAEKLNLAWEEVYLEDSSKFSGAKLYKFVRK